MNPLMTLEAIRTQQLYAGAWSKLLHGLGYTGGNYDPERRVSLGDIASTNGAEDALWCTCALNRSGIAVRRAVISGAVLPAVKRAAVYTDDVRVHDCIAALEQWCAGDDRVDMVGAAEVMRDAVWTARGARAQAGSYAAWAAKAAAGATKEIRTSAGVMARVKDAVAWAAYAGLKAESVFADNETNAPAEAERKRRNQGIDAARNAELKRQRQDIIAAFPPVALKGIAP